MKINKNYVGQGTGVRLQQVRNSLNYTKGQMAARLETKQSTYYKNENGETRPGWKTLYILQMEFGISMDWLMFNKGPVYLKDKNKAIDAIQKERTQEKNLLKRTQQQLQEVQAAQQGLQGLETVNALKKLLPELDLMLQGMLNDPELRHDMMLNFHRCQKVVTTVAK